ncbi:MAG: hypothetical protein M5U07_21915 [Xanthobacteraceae bacterium]|nr:hypothetical protein [Xanthobacteraceae bacterium]
MNVMTQTEGAGSPLRALAAEEIDAVSGGKKAIAVLVEKCTVKKDADGNDVQTCKLVSGTRI